MTASMTPVYLYYHHHSVAHRPCGLTSQPRAPTLGCFHRRLPIQILAHVMYAPMCCPVPQEPLGCLG